MPRALLLTLLPALLAGCLSPADPFEEFSLGEGSLYTKTEEGRTEIAYEERGTVTRVELTGELLLSEDGREVLAMAPGTWMAVWDDAKALSFEQVQRELVRTFIVAGKRRDWTAAAQQWQAEVLAVLTARTAVGARARGRALLAARGPAALVAGLPELESTSARAAYVDLLLQVPELEPALLVRLVEVGARIEGVPTSAALLEALAPRAPDSAELTRAILAATGTLPSSGARARVVTELARLRPLTGELARSAVEVCGGIPSDSARTEALLAVLAAMPVEVATAAAWLERVCAVSPSSNQEAAFTAFLARAAAVPPALVLAARALPCVASEPTRAGLAAQLARSAHADPALFEALVDLAADLATSAGQERVLGELVARPDLDPASLERLAAAIADVASSEVRERLQRGLDERLPDITE